MFALTYQAVRSSWSTYGYVGGWWLMSVVYMGMSLSRPENGTREREGKRNKTILNIHTMQKRPWWTKFKRNSKAYKQSKVITTSFMKIKRFEKQGLKILKECSSIIIKQQGFDNRNSCPRSKLNESLKIKIFVRKHYSSTEKFPERYPLFFLTHNLKIVWGTLGFS